MKKAIVIPLAVLGVLVLVGAGAFMFLSKPAEAVTYEDSVNAESRESNTDLRTALALGGLDSTFVNVADGRVYVGYDVPADSDLSADDWQRFVLGAAASVVPDSTTIVARQFVDEKASSEWTVETAKVLAHQEGDLSADDLEAAITKTAL